MPGMHGPLGFTTRGCPAATPARPQQPPPKGAPWLPTAGHGRVDSTPTLAAGHFILHHQVDFSSCTPGRHLRLGLVTQQGPSRARSAGRSAVLGSKPQQGEFKAIPRLYIYMYTYIIYTYTHMYIYIYIYVYIDMAVCRRRCARSSIIFATGLIFMLGTWGKHGGNMKAT